MEMVKRSHIEIEETKIVLEHRGLKIDGFFSSSDWSHFCLHLRGRELLQANSGEKDLIRARLKEGYRIKTPAQEELYRVLHQFFHWGKEIPNPLGPSFTIDEIFCAGTFFCHRTHLNHEANWLVAVGLLDKEKTKIGGLEKAEFSFTEMVILKGWDWFIMDNRYFKLPLKGLNLV